MAWNPLKKLRQRKQSRNNPSRKRLFVETLESRNLLAGLTTHEIMGTVFLDDDGNGIQNGAEQVVQGATINLFLDDGNGMFDGGDTASGNTTSNGSGLYQFTGLAQGTYFVQQPAQTAGTDLLVEVVSGALAVADVGGTIVDSFDTTAQSVSATNAGTNPDFSSLSALEAIGGERDIFAELTSVSGRIEILVNDATPGAVEFGALATSTGTRELTWDGPDGDAQVLDETGLANADLTDGGASTALKFTIGADQNNGMATIRVFTDANNWSEANLTIPNTGGSATQMLISLYSTDFVQMGANGPANMATVGAIQFEVDGVQAIDVQMDLIQAVGPLTTTQNIANPVFTPGIQIEKATNGQDADSATGPFIPVGDAVTWTYEVTNTGNTVLGSVAVTDDQGVTITFTGGDTNNNSLLELTETWTYQATGTATTGQYSNVGSVDANPVDNAGADIAGQANATDTDPSNYFGAQAGINIEKATNGQDADTGVGPLIAVGGPVIWTYTVTNTGNVQLDGITVSDDQGVTVNFVGGDTDNDSRLDVSETWVYQATGTATAGQYTNIGSASGNPVDAGGTDIAGMTDPTDTDPSNHFGSQPAVQVEKSTNGQDADTPTGLQLFVGTTANFAYTVTNTGNVPLSNVVLSDDNGTSIVGGDDFNPAFTGGDADNDNQLDLTEIWTYAAMRVVTQGQHTNIASVTAEDAIAQDVDDTDASNHLGVAIFSKRRLLASSL